VLPVLLAPGRSVEEIFANLSLIPSNLPCPGNPDVCLRMRRAMDIFPGDAFVAPRLTDTEAGKPLLLFRILNGSTPSLKSRLAEMRCSICCPIGQIGALQRHAPQLQPLGSQGHRPRFSLVADAAGLSVARPSLAGTRRLEAKGFTPGTV
jgi:hypothetical protein